MRRTRSILALLMVGGLAACGGIGDPYSGPMAFDTLHVVVEQGDRAGELVVEVAETERQQMRGLTGRDRLDEGSGMLFVFDSPRPADEGFWMWRTRIPLDIAFLDEAGTIVALLSMEPCDETYSDDCTHYTPGVPYVSALETNEGWFESHGLREGARMQVTGRP